MSGYWRRRLAEALDLDPRASWYDVERALVVLRGQAALDRRNAAEMVAFIGQAQLYWWSRGAQGHPPPSSADGPAA